MGKQEDRKSQGRHASRDRQQPARRREPLRDNYYYEEPSRGGDSFDQFEEIVRPLLRGADHAGGHSGGHLQPHGGVPPGF